MNIKKNYICLLLGLFLMGIYCDNNQNTHNNHDDTGNKKVFRNQGWVPGKNYCSDVKTGEDLIAATEWTIVSQVIDPDDINKITITRERYETYLPWHWEIWKEDCDDLSEPNDLVVVEDTDDIYTKRATKTETGDRRPCYPDSILENEKEDHCLQSCH